MRRKKNEMRQQPFHVRFQASDDGFHLKMGEVWKYRDLVVLLTKKTFTMTYQQTVLGPLWIIINPILASLIYMFIFGKVAQIGTDGIPQMLFYFTSSSVWAIFSYSLTANANTFVSNAYLFSKVYFPRLTVPISNMLVSLLKFCVQLILIAVLMIVYGLMGKIHPMWEYFVLLPLVFLQLSVLGMSVGILFSSMTTKYRDLSIVVPVIANLWMYASAVVFPMSSLHEGTLKTILKINPVTEQIELIRMILTGQGQFELSYYLIGLAVTIMLFFASAVVFNHVERTFADTV